MSDTAVMTLRLPREVKRGVERLAARFGHKPAQLGARFIEEGLRRRDFPQIDLRETAAGRVAYLGGTRFTVQWIADLVPATMTPDAFASAYDVPVDRVRTALAYAGAFAGEIESDRAQADANRQWIARQDAAMRRRSPAATRTRTAARGKAAR
jgi:uncharacterized protein (DUF433 family)